MWNEAMIVARDPATDVNEADPSDGVTALHIAAFYGKDTLLKLLIQREGDPGLGDRSGRTPAMYAIVDGRYDIVRLLVAAGASPNTCDLNGNTLGALDPHPQ